MTFRELPPKPQEPKSLREIEMQFEQKNADRLAEMQYRLTKDYALDANRDKPSEMTISLQGGRKVSEVEFTAKGLTVRFAITPTSIREIYRRSNNDSEQGGVGVEEDFMAEEYKFILNNYFADFPDQRP